jgi:hypothetical protein
MDVNIQDSDGDRISTANPLPVSVEDLSVTVSTGIFNSDIDKINGNTVDVSSGNKGTGTLRVAIATDDVPTKLTNDSLGAIADAIVDAGATGSLSAKMRRLTTDVGALFLSLGTAASAIPTRVLMVGGSDGTNARAVKTDTSGNLTIVRVALSNTWTQLTEPGSTTGFATPGKTDHTVAATVAAINTNVVVRVEGSVDNTSWFNLDASETDTTISSNGTRGFKFTGALAYIRLTFVSESGGTAATIDAKYLGQ